MKDFPLNMPLCFAVRKTQGQFARRWPAFHASQNRVCLHSLDLSSTDISAELLVPPQPITVDFLNQNWSGILDLVEHSNELRRWGGEVLLARRSTAEYLKQERIPAPSA